MQKALDTAVLVTAVTLAGFTDLWRSQSNLPTDPPLALSEAIPPHLTLLSPWDLEPWSERARTRLGRAVHRIPSFQLRFSSVGTLPTGHVYLDPEPSRDLATLFSALTNAFPEFPPYDGAFSEWLPHLTVSRRGGEPIATDVRHELAAHGPLVLDVNEVSAWEYLPSGRWIRHLTAPLAG